jgi:hypothetical protein
VRRYYGTQCTGHPTPNRCPPPHIVQGGVAHELGCIIVSRRGEECRARDAWGKVRCREKEKMPSRNSNPGTWLSGGAHTPSSRRGHLASCRSV